MITRERDPEDTRNMVGMAKIFHSKKSLDAIQGKLFEDMTSGVIWKIDQVQMVGEENERGNIQIKEGIKVISARVDIVCLDWTFEGYY